MERSRQQRSSSRKRHAFPSFGVRLRFASLLIVLSVFVAFGLRLSHMLLVQHVICEHGHLVDEGRTSAIQETARGADPRDNADDHDAGNLDDHDHCDVMSVLHGSDSFSITPSVTKLWWIELLGIEEARATFPMAVIVLAPKTSPPVG